MAEIAAKDYRVLRVNLMAVLLGKNLRRTKHEQESRTNVASGIREAYG